MTPAATRLLRFAAFELDLSREELRRAGVLVKLSPQQFRLLRLLAEHSGEVCTREQIQQEIWGAATFVDFDRSLNVCIAQIRAALHDDSDSPRFIQTLPRRGYRFVAAVESVADATEPKAEGPPPRRRSAAIPLAILLAAAGIAGAFLFRTDAPVPRTMMAVLPLENIAHDPEDEVSLDGLLDELITQFGTLSPARLGVIGRTSVVRYRGQSTPVTQIGAELGVTYVVEGDLRREGNERRISLRLVKVADQAQAWNDTYEFSGTGVLEFQEDVAARAGAAVVRILFPQSPAPAARHHPAPAAYEAVANGRYLQHKHTLADFQRSLEWYSKAEAIDPAWAEPWAASAGEEIALALSGAFPAPDAFAKANDAATRALQIEETSAEAHNAMGNVALWRDWNYSDARRHFERALVLNPSFAQAHHDYAFLQVITGHPESGVISLKRALALDPLSPRVNVDAGWVLLQAHRFDEAIRQARRALELEPGLREAYACIARAELYQGKRRPEDIQFFRKERESADPYRRAIAAAELGERAEAMAALRQARDEHHLLMSLAGTEPAFDSLRGDAAFQEIARLAPR